MSNYNEHLVEKRVTYTLEMNGKYFVVENVPARVNEETGEQFFAPSTVEQLHKTILERQTPDKVIEIPVYTYKDKVIE